jgi:mono/diheme cytochrome c family protein
MLGAISSRLGRAFVAMSYKKMMKGGLAATGLLATLTLLPVAVQGGHSTGHTSWTANCAGCHGATPVNPQFNAAGEDNGTIAYVITQVPAMAGVGGNHTAIAQYIATLLPSTNKSIAMDAAVVVNVGATLSLTGIAFTHVRTTTNPTNGTLTYPAATNWASVSNIYTPNDGFVGVDSFTYRGYKSGTTTADSRTVTINVGSAPVWSSSTSRTATVGNSFSHTLVASNNPTYAITVGSLPPGLTRSGALISGTPTTAGTYPMTVRATNYWDNVLSGGVTQSLTITVNKGTQTVSFGAQPTPRTYAPSSPANQFPILPLATTNAPGAAITYTSNTPTKCSVSGTTVTILSVGDGVCTIQANGASTSNYNSDTAIRTVTIVKANQTITFASQATQNYVQGGTFPITTGTASSGLLVTYDTTQSPTICSVAGTTVSILQSGNCIVRASQVGNGNYNAAPQVSRTVIINPVAPVAPTIGAVTAGPNQLSVSFTPSSNTGNGRPLTSLRATCGPLFADGTSSPIVVSGLANDTLYSCSVTATNDSALTSAASGTAGGTPSAAPMAPTISSVNNATFTVLAANTFTVTSTGVPAPTFSLSAGVPLPSGITLNGTTGVISGTPVSGTVGAYNFTVRATNASGFNDQPFTLTVGKRAQSISFTDPADQKFSLSATPLVASASPSGLAVSLVSNTPAVCGISGSNATILSVGDCTINASQAGNGDYLAATPVPQTFTISKGDQAITFGTQAVTSRPFGAAAFSVSPIATASSNLAIAYGSSTPGVCSVVGTTVTMIGLGTCRLTANQAGNANWNAASEASQDVQITIGPQSITFAATQPAQLLVPAGTFALSPLASATSGLPVSYTSITPAVCTIAGTTITMGAVGTCTIAANQEGNANYSAAPQVTRNITINPNVPGAPAIGTVTPAATGQLSVNFTEPTNDGGSAIIDYTATCNPGGFSQLGAASPIIVSGMANGVSYTCSVKARNAVGQSAASSTVPGIPSAAGPGIWANVCSTCHGDTPAGARFNAAGTTRTVLNHVIASQPDMNVPTVQALTNEERDDLVAYITSYLTPVQQSVAPNTAKQISVGSHLSLNTQAATFQQVEIVTLPSHGTLGTFTGTKATYTPTPGYTGTDTFTYRGKNTNVPFNGDTHTATITVDPNLRVLNLSVVGGTNVGIVLVTAPEGTTFCNSTCNEVFANGTMLTLMAAPEVGLAFMGWGGACSGTAPDCDVTMDAVKSVTATFAGIQHTLTVSKAGTGAGTVTSSVGGIDCGSMCAAPYGEGSLVTLTASPAAGSAFTGWSGGVCTGIAPCNVTMSQARSVTATFTLGSHPFTVSKAGTGTGSVSSSPAGIDCGATCLGNFNTGVGVTLTASPVAGSTFAGWSGSGCTGTGTCQLTADAAKSVTATFNVSAGTNALTVVRSGTGTGTVTSSPVGIDCGLTCTAGFAPGTPVILFALPAAGTTFAGWSGDCTGNGVCNVTLSAARNVTATFNAPTGSLSPNSGSIDFGGQSMGTTSPAQNVVVTNSGASPVTVSAVSLTSSEFGQTNNCTTLAAGASCTIAVTFSPLAQAGPLNTAVPVGGTLNVTHNGTGGTLAVTVFGTAEKSLVTHYYRSILRRAPDAGGVPYWQGEAARVAGLGANVNETWYALAQAFYTSAEYLAFNRDDAGYVADLYATFFNRTPDQAGSDYWVGLMSQGMPREVVLVSFMISPEFAAFTQAIFGNTAARAEVDTVIDFYRGILSRLPDSAGFNYWVGQFRTAQCQGPAAVYAQVEAISNAYMNSPEYGARGRTNSQFVGDLYNAFLRRGGDLAGVEYWIGQLTTAARTRENERQAFISTPEFGARVQAIINQGCMN